MYTYYGNTRPHIPKDGGTFRSHSRVNLKSRLFGGASKNMLNQVFLI